MFLLQLLLACNPSATPSTQLDLVEVLGAGQVRVGEVTDEAALFGGVSAEGRLGDFKLYNDRVQFIVQGDRDGYYYMAQRGNVVDADIVREPGAPGRDIIDEWLGQLSVGRMLDADTIEVIDDGASGTAHLRASGWESPMALIEGALEAPGFIDDLGLYIVVDYELPADSWLMKVTSTIVATNQQASFEPGDLMMGALDVADTWEPGLGLETSEGDFRSYAGYVGQRDQVAVAVIPADSGQMRSGGVEAFSFLLDFSGSFVPEVTLQEGERYIHTRYYGVGPDMATLSDARLLLSGESTRTVAGKVSAADGPVAGARVNVLVDEQPYTLAVTDAEGRFSAAVPTGSAVSLLAVGRGTARFLDRPAGAGSWSPYAGATAQALTLASIRDGATPVPQAVGRGVASEDDPLVLGVPGSVRVKVSDGQPFEVWARFRGERPEADRRLVPEWPNGMAAQGWSRDGEVELLLPAGDYHLIVHRGARFELHEEDITVSAGGNITVRATLDQAYPHPGWVFGDPHCHASPSPDGHLPMEDRLMTQAGTGVQLHFGTDHDHVVDYNPLLPALGLQDVLVSVVATEISSVLRGHKNAYPLVSDPSKPNGGAWRWWLHPVTSTEDEIDQIRARIGDDPILQINHPIGVGMADLAGWTEDGIERPDFWSERFDAMEVNNGGNNGTFLPVYFDRERAGHRITATGTTDSHYYLSGHPGINGTWIGIGSDDVRDYSDDKLIEAFRSRRTIATRGPYLSLSVAPGSVVSKGSAIEVEARAPSWIVVDRLLLLEDGAEIERVSGTSASFTLPTKGAFYNIVAEGDTPMEPLYGATPWAMTSAYYVE